jgi:hypothetical protein
MFEKLETCRCSPPRCPADAQAVRDWLPEFLNDFSIPLDKFGTGRHKSLEDLSDEIQKGETRLEVDHSSGRLIRVGAVVRLDVLYLPAYSTPLKLYEAEQRFIDGRCRQRPTEFAVWEKLRADEDPDFGMLRALREELKLTGTIHALPGKQTQIMRDPDDYPMIASRFRAFDFVVHLSSEQFLPHGYQETQRDKTTTFRWRPLGSCCAQGCIPIITLV